MAICEELNIHSILEFVNEEFNVRGIDAWHINNGYCSEWADKVFSQLLHTEHTVECWETIFGFSNTSHCFVRINGMFYDAECLNGVGDHMELPIFAKLSKLTKEREPVWLIDYSSNGFWDVDKFDVTTEIIDQYNAENN